MQHTSKSSKTLAVALLLLGAVVLIVLPAFANNGDYGVNTGVSTAAPTATAEDPLDYSRPTDVKKPTQVIPPTNTPAPPTNTPVPPTATPSGPTPTPTCIDGQWGQEPNGSWVCIPNSELTQQAGG